MARIIIFEVGVGTVLQYIPSGDTPQYERRPDALINPPGLLPLLAANIPTADWIVDPPTSLGDVRELTQAEKDIRDSEVLVEQAVQAATERASQGQEIVAKLQGEFVRQAVSNADRLAIVEYVKDVLVLMPLGELAEAKRRINNLSPTAAVSSGNLDIVKNFLNGEIT